ncbi:MAG: transglycosylase domain-containing protein [Bernardetiaceae bacterium]|nr:transglycosylase domain-containing protein [Bernardetiaceae bacterium]
MRFFKPRLGDSLVMHVIRGCWYVFFASCLACVLYFKSVEYNWFGWYGAMPDVKLLENPKMPTPSELYTADGVLIGRFYKENRIPVEYRELSPNLINALEATEDIRFRDHAGIDLPATLSILWYTLRGDRRGGSTISQQLAKNLYRTRRKDAKGSLSVKYPQLTTPIYKTKEWITAVDLEKTYTKEEIITLYFNTVEFGGGAFGVKTAAKVFFSTTPDQLTIPQAAMLVGMLKNPTTFSPIRRPERTLERRNVVFNQMLKYNFITREQYDAFCKTPLGLQKSVEREEENGAATYFRGVMNQYLENWCEENDLDLYADGLKIYTTIDSRVQAHAEAAVAKKMKEFQKIFDRHWGNQYPWRYKSGAVIPNYVENIAIRQYRREFDRVGRDTAIFLALMSNKKKMSLFSWDKGEFTDSLSVLDSIEYCKRFLHTGLMAMNPHSGYIRAWVGGINYKYFKFDHVKRSFRQPGSTFKPFIYAAAIDSFGYSPCATFLDAPVTIKYQERNSRRGHYSFWTPHNASQSASYARVTMRYGLGRSLNTVAARVTEAVGWGSVINYARKLGITTRMDSVPSVGLGSSEVTLYDMVGAYGTFLNEGIWTEPQFITRVEDRSGRIIHRFRPKTRRALKPESAYLMVHMLRGGLQESGGTSRRLFSYPKVVSNNELAGKTGSSSNYVDAWYMGLTRDLVTGVWVGGDDSSIHFRTGQYGEGSKTALPIFATFMENVYSDSTNLGITKGRFPTEQELRLTLNKNLICPSVTYTGYRPRSDSTANRSGADSTSGGQ